MFRVLVFVLRMGQWVKFFFCYLCTSVKVTWALRKWKIFCKTNTGSCTCFCRGLYSFLWSVCCGGFVLIWSLLKCLFQICEGAAACFDTSLGVTATFFGSLDTVLSSLSQACEAGRSGTFRGREAWQSSRESAKALISRVVLRKYVMALNK